jgi:hypothetical protein
MRAHEAKRQPGSSLTFGGGISTAFVQCPKTLSRPPKHLPIDDEFAGHGFDANIDSLSLTSLSFSDPERLCFRGGSST